MSINDLRSRLSDIARRSSGLSKGGASRLTIRLRLTLAENIADRLRRLVFDVLQLRHRDAGINSPILPDMKAKRRVETSLMIVHSIPSR